MSAAVGSAATATGAALAETAETRASTEARPPTRQEIASFMLAYSAHLPHPLLDGDSSATAVQKNSAPAAAGRTPSLTPPSRLLAPFHFTGADYALVLSACFPARCVDLTLLNWSSSPLPSQRVGNLRVFCEAARALALPDAPLSALHPEMLQRNPACVVAHLKVQHWLYSLSRRFVPAGDHDAAALRVAHKHLQLGEPYVQRRRVEGAGQPGAQDTCSSLHECAPLSAESLQQCCGVVFAAVPPFTEAAGSGEASSSTAATGTAPHQHQQPESSTAGVACARGSKEGEEATARPAKEKPWLNYTKPWRLPLQERAAAKKAAVEAAAAKREREERESNPRYTAFANQSANIEEQYALSRAAVRERTEQLRRVKADLMRDIIEGRAVEFKDLAARLRECR